MFRMLKSEFARVVAEHGLADEPISITARPLTPNEAIGNPEDSDYPILKGKERMMEAVFLKAKGQAFTDMCGNWSGKLADILRMDLTNNFRRALFISSLNAVMRHLGITERTVHCKNEGPVRCSEECLEMMTRGFPPSSRILLIGYQPRMAEQLSKRFTVSIVDMDKDNIGMQVFGTTIHGPEMTEQSIKNADVLLVTGTTFVNGTMGQFLGREIPTIFYGITSAGVANLLGLRRHCPFGL
ncbi:MAG: hypothetical protein C4532_18165 [Candidatus Abyssobacteria bacterium SURF_17]|uniref:Putative heavy-metal chelation domain-containing protein n=1 Tax=Candidatus Abyssobacteria bacterium SURF_17 TaxID=2093361 RepID=A0A419EPN8_9BACT|nr:MAG: hypothetical protein C4532_18165 [Candidatus Abyssubacteria bacterium SURF_17]